jgi:putative ABC transport system permease protein
MFTNYLKTAFRNLIGNKTCSFLNILGLAVGMAVCVLILIYIRYELDYDKCHEYNERIYRVSRTYLDDDGSIQSEPASVALSFIPLLGENFPEIDHCAGLLKGKDNVFGYEEKSFVETGLYYPEDDIFKVFTIPFVSGNPESALADPVRALRYE